MRVFVVHYRKLVDRRESMERQLRAQSVAADDVEYVDIDRDELARHDVTRFGPEIGAAQRANFLSHIYAFERIAADGEGLILEDDALLDPDFASGLEMYRTQLPPDYDMLFVGSGCNLHIPSSDLLDSGAPAVYHKGLEPTTWGGDGATRCTDSYLVSPKCARALLDFWRRAPPGSVRLPIDWWLNIAARATQAVVLWAEPTIVRQGSECGTFLKSYAVQ